MMVYRLQYVQSYNYQSCEGTRIAGKLPAMWIGRGQERGLVSVLSGTGIPQRQQKT